MARSKAGPAIDTRRDLVVCVDGPRGGQWHYLDDWKGMRRSGAAQQFQSGDPADTVLGYVTTRQHRDHPVTHGVTGYALRWDPAQAARATTTATGAA